MTYVPNPTRPGGRKPVRLITDRAKRYRAQRQAGKPQGKRCAYCGASATMVDHVDGNESHGNPSNLMHACRSCNGKKAAAFRRAGRGRPTRQFNPPNTASSGARNLGQWLTAVLSLRGQGEMKLSDAIAVVHATPPAKRSEFADQIWERRRARGTDTRVPF